MLRIRPPKTLVLHVLMLLLLWLLLKLWLLVDRLREVRKGIREIMAGEAAPVWWHRGWFAQ